MYIALAIVVVLLIASLRIAQEYPRAIVFRLGRYAGTRGPGLYWLLPFIERQQTLDMRTRTVEMEQQETITKDSVTIKVNAVLWYRVVNPADAVIKVASYDRAVYQLAVTALRNIIGQNQLDGVLKERGQINGTLLQIVDAATETGTAILTLLRDLASREGKTVVMATHSADAAAVAHRIVRMKDGRIIPDDPG